MKVKPEHVEYMRQRIEETLRSVPDAVRRYETGDFPRSDRVEDLGKRFRWDVATFALGPQWISDTLYPYVHDEHIDTVLRRIVPRIERKY